jgi:glycine betaine/proline transport system permease protein
MDWLTENKLPIDDIAEAGFDWLQINGGWFFDGLAELMEKLIDAILWVLQTPHPLIIIIAFAVLAWFIQRNWKTVGFIVVGFLFILNQDYWEETTESLTLVLSACVVCMGIGVPIGIAPAHRPKLYRFMRPVLDLMQTLPTDPCDCLFWHRNGAGIDCNRDFRAASTYSPDTAGHFFNTQGIARGC